MMRTKILILSIAVLLFASVGTLQSNAQEPILPTQMQVDLGEENLLILACKFMKIRAQEQDVTINYCRRGKPDIINEDSAVITTNIRVDNSYNLSVRISFMRSIWWVDNWKVEEE